MAKPHFNFTPEELQSEEWRPVPNYEGFYSVSSIGRVRRDKRAGNTPRDGILAQFLDDEGYCGLSLSKNGDVKHALVHWLVMSAFTGERPPGMVTNHKDGNGSNNRIGNLEYVTYSENTKHGLYVLGANQRVFQTPEHKAKHFAATPRGEQSGMAKITTQDVLEMRRIYDAGGVTALELSERWGVSHKQACRIVNRESWKHVP